MFEPEVLQHGGRQVLRIDYRGMSLAEVVASMRRSMEIIAAQPPNSVLALTYWDVALSDEMLQVIRQHVTLNTPFIRASAVVSPWPLQRVTFEDVTVGGRERLKSFDDEAQALAWLVTR